MVRRETSGRRRVVLDGFIALLASGAPAAVEAQEEFKCGAVSPVTGPIPQFGEYFLRGRQLGLEDLEKGGGIGGRKIRIVLEDSENDPKISLAALSNLLSVDKVPIVETVGHSVVQNIHETFRVVDRVYVLKLGRIVFEDSPQSPRRTTGCAAHTSAEGSKAWRQIAG